MKWDRNARYWRRPDIRGGNINRWTPLDAYRPYIGLWVALGAVGVAYVWWPEYVESVAAFMFGLGIGIVFVDEAFHEFRSSIYQHLDTKYGPNWQKYDDNYD